MVTLFQGIHIQLNPERKLEEFLIEHPCGYTHHKTLFEGGLDNLVDGVYVAKKEDKDNLFLIKGNHVIFYRGYDKNGKVVFDHMKNNPLHIWAIEKSLRKEEP